MTKAVFSAHPTIAITGASAGIGEETALLFAERGWRVVLGARRQDRLEAVAKKLKVAGAHEVVIAQLDVTVDDSVKKFAEAGIGTRPFFWGLHEQPVLKNYNINVQGSFPISEHMSRQGFYLPSGLAITESQINYVCDTLLKIFK